MALFDASTLDFITTLGADYSTAERGAEITQWSGTGGGLTYYAMRAVDVNAPSLTYRYWVVSGTPDTNGSRYTGLYSGGGVNFSGFSIQKVW